ncbi:MAG: hypothetical protein E6Q42_00470 [Dechloromonas sp.]|jgi:hypothetical protein|nr:MAG: hypothetical protein E6Q42_00470 [Dechloromonas sp.]
MSQPKTIASKSKHEDGTFHQLQLFGSEALAKGTVAPTAFVEDRRTDRSLLRLVSSTTALQRSNAGPSATSLATVEAQLIDRAMFFWST